jgi:fibronectin-binding autotransporter adhesin
MRSLRCFGTLLCAALLLSGPAARAQLVTDGGTTVINFSTNITGTVDIGTSADNTLLVITNGGDVRNTGIAYIGHNAGSEFNRVFVNGIGSYWSNVSDLFIGFEGANNSLFIQNGGTVSNRTGTLGGNSAGATNNLVVVDGAGSLWINQNDLEIGLLGGGNTVLVTNGGRVVVRSAIAADGTYLGHFAGAGNNRLIVSGTNSAFSNLFTLHHGYGAGGNLIRVADGGRLDTEVTYVGEFASASSNEIEVTGTGSLYRNMFEFVVGSNSAGNRVTVSEGGRLMNTVGTLGGSATAPNNIALVTGGGSLWSNSGNLYIGNLASGNRLTISNGGAVRALNGYLGFAAGSSNNALLVRGAGSTWSNSGGSFFLGLSGNSNQVVVSDGGAMFSGASVIGTDTTAISNLAVVTGVGSYWSNNSELRVGGAGRGNQLVVSDGGVARDNFGYLGAAASSGSNTALVTGPGSLWTNTSDLWVGFSGRGNLLTLSNGGTVAANNNLVIGREGVSLNNRIVNSGGNLLVRNATGTGVFDIRRGTNVLNSGLVDVDQLVMTNALGLFEFNGGTLITRGGLISNGAPFVVGASGTTPAIWDVRAGVSNMVVNNFLIIGSIVANSQLLITNGATLAHIGGTGAYPGYIGFTTNSTSNTATIAGAGSLWNLASNDLIVGSVSSGNRLVVSNGGVVRNDEGAVGHLFTGSNNVALVTGSGSLWSNGTGLYLGIQSGGNQLLVSNAGVVSASNLYVGYNQSQSAGNRLYVSAGGRVDATNNGYIGGDNNSGSSNNLATIDGAGSLWRSGNSLFIGAAGSQNGLVVTNGGTVADTTGYIGGNPSFFSSFGSFAVVTGGGSLWSNAMDLHVGFSSLSASNQLLVSSGGTVLSSNGFVGFASAGNSAVVTGAGSLWSNRNTLTVGNNASGNLLIVSNSGTVFASNGVYLGFNPGALANRIEITGGNLIVTNLAGTGTLDVRRGTNVLNGGLVDADRVFVTNTLGRFEFLKGIFRSRHTEITNGLSFEVGNGTDIAFAELEGAGPHRFGNGLVIRSNATLRARTTGFITSPAGVNIQMGGTLLYQLPNQLAAATPLTLSGGRFDLGGNTQAAALGALTLSATSTIDLGTGGTQTLQFSSLASHTPGSLLIIQNWAGTPTYGGGTDQLLFTGGAGVTAGFLSEVRFVGFPDGALLLGTGEIVPTPEPATWLALVALGGTLLRRRRR